MYRLDREDFVQSPFIALWSLLSFQAGYLNAFGFLACGRYISHVTGFGTQIGVAMANHNLAFAIELLGIPLTFILGSFTGGILTSAKIERGLKPRFDIVTALIPVLIFALLLFGESNLFGVFGEPLVFARDFLLLFMLSFACGMQNGCFAVLTKGQIRTTHLTGISTDMGTDLARMWFGNLKGKELELTRRTNYSRVVTFLSFTVGSILSVIVGNRMQYASLIVPLVTSFASYCAVRLVSRLLDERSNSMTRAVA